MHKPEEAIESKQQETQILRSEFMVFLRNSLKLKHVKTKYMTHDNLSRSKQRKSSHFSTSQVQKVGGR
jgi:hypothetical protein